MKAKFGMIVTEGRGKIGGHVASRNRSGAYFRTKVSPVNPSTSAQVLARLVLSNFSTSWRTLSQAERDAWNAAVGDFASTDIFGDLRNPTGKNLYTKLNVNLVNIGAAPISTPPLLSDTAPHAASGLSIAVGASEFDLSFTGSDAGFTLLIEATDGLSAGIGFFKNRYRVIGTVAGNASSPADLWAEYVAKFGEPVAGMKVAVRIVPINNTTGQQFQPSFVSAIVAA